MLFNRVKASWGLIRGCKGLVMFYEGRGWESCTGFYVESVGRVIRSKQVLSWSLGWQKRVVFARHDLLRDGDI